MVSRFAFKWVNVRRYSPGDDEKFHEFRGLTIRKPATEMDLWWGSCQYEL